MKHGVRYRVWDEHHGAWWGKVGCWTEDESEAALRTEEEVEAIRDKLDPTRPSNLRFVPVDGADGGVQFREVDPYDIDLDLLRHKLGVGEPDGALARLSRIFSGLDHGLSLEVREDLLRVYWALVDAECLLARFGSVVEIE